MRRGLAEDEHEGRHRIAGLLALPARHSCRAKRWFLGEEAVVRGERMSQRRALRRIERDLVRSDPRLNALFTELTGLGGDKEMPVTEQISTGPHWLPARLGRRARSPDGRGLASPADDSLSARQSIRLRHECALRWLCPFPGVRSTGAARFGDLWDCWGPGGGGRLQRGERQLQPERG